MEIIDATAKLKTSDFNKLRKFVKDDDMILTLVENTSSAETLLEFETKAADFRSIFEGSRFDVADEDQVTFCTEEIALVTTGAWYKKWCQPTWSCYIFKEKTEKTEKTAKTSTSSKIKVMIAYEDDTEHATCFEGSSSECANFINKEGTIMRLKAFDDRKVVYNIADKGWKTLKEWISEGVLA